MKTSVPKRPSAAAATFAAIAATMALAASCRTVPTPRIGDAGRRPLPGSATASANGAPLPVEAYVPGPIVRVGIIVDGPRAVVTADSGLIVREAGALAREVPLPAGHFRGHRSPRRGEPVPGPGGEPHRPARGGRPGRARPRSGEGGIGRRAGATRRTPGRCAPATSAPATRRSRSRRGSSSRACPAAGSPKSRASPRRAG